MVAKKNTNFKKPIKNVAIVYRPGLEQAKNIASEVGNWLNSKKIKIYSHPKRKFKVQNKNAPIPKNIKNIDLVVVLGGDGTYLEAVRMLAGHNSPILGVNLGSLGFLTENTKDDLYKVLSMTLDGKMQMRPRTLLNAKVKSKNRVKHKINALNDIVIERGSRSHLISLNVACDKMPVSEIKADGVIVSSPTGSTAYNLAAGGPILHPEVNAFVLTPICPHSLTSRAIIFPDNKYISFQLTHSHSASLTVDGKSLCEITEGDEVIISKCEYHHYVLKKPTHNYFDLLNKKLKFGQR